MGVAHLILVANPGSASRKYGLYRNTELLAKLHFEHKDGTIVCQLKTKTISKDIACAIDNIAGAAHLVEPILKQHDVLNDTQKLHSIGLRIVAPTSFFLEDRQINDHARQMLEELQKRAPLHVGATLNELRVLAEAHPDLPIIGVSDSKFHVSKPDKAWNYGLPLDDADHYEIKRFGYHGISVTSVVNQLAPYDVASNKTIVCHLGSGASVTAVHQGKSHDTTMGYSPLEGLIMASRSGTIDYIAGNSLRDALGMDDSAFIEYLNENSGLLGLSGISDDIRDIIEADKKGSQKAHLALETYIYAIQKAIGQMAGAMNGVDMLVFTGTVGERSSIIRSKVTERLGYLGFTLDSSQNTNCTSPLAPTTIHVNEGSKPVLVVSTDESLEMAKSVLRLTK